MRCVIVGLHAAGRSACEWLRRVAPHAEILGVDPEPGPPYARPLISYVLDREIQIQDLQLADAGYWDRLGASILPERAVALDADRKRLTLASGRELGYDRLLLACGAAPRLVPLPGEAAKEICYFRGKADLERVLARVKPGGLAAVLGGGLVGFKLTMGLLARGMRVVLLVASPRPLALNVDAHVGAWAAAQFAATEGVDLRTRTEVVDATFAPDGRVRLSLADGTSLDADLVAAGKGVTPELGWLSAAGLAVNDGVLADNRLRTSAPDVFVAGDLAETWDLVHEAPRVNAIWPMAVEQGRIAALNMAGLDSPYDGSLAMNAIPLFGKHMVSIGAVNPRFTGDAQCVEAMGPAGSYLNLVFREQRLIGAIGLNAAPRLGELAWAVRRRMKQGDIPSHWLSNPVGAAPLADRSCYAARNARP